jgi:hypothetical protein
LRITNRDAIALTDRATSASLRLQPV